jgi:hypothetical protein
MPILKIIKIPILTIFLFTCSLVQYDNLKKIEIGLVILILGEKEV